MSKRIEHFSAGLALLLVLIGVYSDKLFGSGYIFTEVIQDITNVYGFYPWDQFSAEQLRGGFFPLWNSHNGLGVPHLANMQSAVFYPLNWLKYLFGFWKVIDWVLIIRLWAAGFFLYLFARSALKLDFITGLFAGLSYALCGYFLRYVYMSHLNVECLIPLQLLLYFKLAGQRKLIFWILSGLGIYLLIIGGFPEASLYAIGFSGFYFMFSKQGALGYGRKLALLGSTLAFGFLLASVQWLPFYEYLGQAWTYHQGDSGIRHLDLAYAVSMLLPWFFGKNSEGTLIPFLMPGLGVITIIFCLRALMGIGSSLSRIGFWVCASAVLLGLIYGIPPFSWLGKIYPISLTYNFKYAIPVLSLCVSVLSGFGMAAFFREGRKGLDFSAIAIAWIWAGVNLAIALGNGFQPFYGYGAKLEMARLFLAALVLLSVLVLGRFGSLRNFGMVLVILALCGSGYFDYRMNRGMELSEYLFEQTDQARQAQNLFPEPYRYSAEGDILFPNLLLPLEVDDLRSYDPLYPKTYVYLMASINDLKNEAEISKHYNEHKLFQLDREHLNSALAPVLNLMLYSANYPLNTRPIAEAILKEGIETGDFAGWAREQAVGIAGEDKKSLMTYSNGKIQAELSIKPGPAEILFDAGILDREGRWEGDGAQFQIFISGPEGSRLIYSRYLNPGSRLADRGWKPVRIKPGFAGERQPLSLASLGGPKGRNSGDLLAWAGLRFYSPRYEPAGAQNLTEKGELSLNHFAKGFPRYFLVRDAGIAPVRNLEEELKLFRHLNSVQPGYFRSQAILGEAIKFDYERKNLGGSSWVKSVRNDPVLTELELRTPQACFLAGSDQYFPGWTAQVDGRPTRIYRADLALRAIFIPAGEHRVRFRYEPVSFQVGLWAAIGTLLSLALLLIPGLRRESGR